jgi:large subunit ribosomal protein L9
MKVILLKDVKGIGRRYEEKEVSSGHAINFLIPQKLAVPAGSSAAAQAKTHKEQEERSRQSKNEALSQEVAKLANSEVKIALKANEKGHLFASLNAEKISTLLKSEKGIAIDPSCILIKTPIKDTGAHSIAVRIGDKETHFNLTIEGK